MEGLHALKHALRFGARLTELFTDDLDRALATADEVAPELRPLLENQAKVIPTTRFRELSTQPIHTRALAFAVAPGWTLRQTLPRIGHPTILLDDPRNSKNLGAVVRVGAAAGAAGILANGAADLYDTMAVRGAAGLQWAIPCWGSPRLLEELDEINPNATLVGLDANGAAFDPASLTGPVIFAFGSERSGLSDQVRGRCQQIVALEMRPEISSLNLATSVSAVLYLMRYARGGGTA